MLGVTDEADQDVLGAGRNFGEDVAAVGVGGRGAIEVGKGDEGADEGLPGRFIPYQADDPRLGRLKSQ